MPEYETEIKAILSVPSVAAVMPAYEHETEWTKQVRVRAIHAIALSLLLLNTSLYCLSNKSSYSGYPYHFSPSCTFHVLTSVSPSHFVCRWLVTAFGATLPRSSWRGV